MRILTNPGSNLSDELVQRYGIEVLPQHLVVDGVAHDMRSTPRQEQVDEWARTAKRWPSTVGTTAAETVAGLQAALKSGARDVAIVTTSKKIINSYHSAERAVRTLKESPQGAHLNVALIDTMVTDIGALLACVYLGELAKAGRPLPEAAGLCEAFCNRIQFRFALATLENMVKGGRASQLRALAADFLGVGPVCSFHDGEIKVIAKYKRKHDMVDQLMAQMVLAVPVGSAVWAGVMHTADAGTTARLVSALRSSYRVLVLAQRPIAAAVYLHAGPGSIGAAVVPVDGLAVVPDVVL